MKAVVLAAGEGQRLQHLILALKEAEINNFLIVVHHKAEQIKRYFKNGEKLGVKINYVHQKEVAGTADAFGLAEKWMDGEFVAVYGDLLITPQTVKSALNLHETAEATATLTCLRVENPERYGVIRTQEEKVVEIVEKPSAGTAEKPSAGTAAGNLINAGVYVFSPEIFEAIKQTKASPRGEREITDSIRMLIERGRKVVATEISSENWLDVGRPWDLLEAA